MTLLAHAGKGGVPVIYVDIGRYGHARSLHAQPPNDDTCPDQM